MDSELSKLVTNLYAPNWKFWLNKEKIIEDIASHHSKAIFTIPLINKFIDEHLSNQKLVSHTINCISEICNPVLDLIDEIAVLEINKSIIKQFNVHDRGSIKKFRIDLFNKIDHLYKSSLKYDPNILLGIDKISHFLGSGDSVLELSALKCLGQSGPPASHMVSVIRDYLKHPELKFRLMAQFAIENISGEDCGFLNDYFKILISQNSENENLSSENFLILDINNPYFGFKIRNRLPEFMEILQGSADEHAKVGLLLSTLFPLAEEELNTEEQKLLDILFNLYKQNNSTYSLISYLLFFFLNSEISVPFLIQKLYENTLTSSSNKPADVSDIIIALVEIKVGTKDEIPLIKENIEIMKKNRRVMSDEDRVVLYNIEKSFKELVDFHSVA